MTRQLARGTGIALAVLAFLVLMTNVEPHSAAIKARVIEAGLLLASVLLIWYGNRK